MIFKVLSVEKHDP